MVSIIIPVYNCVDRLRTCLESIVKQTYSDIEIILVDDGSDDGSGRICEEFAILDTRIYVYHQNNEGASAARNKGLSLAHGKYIQFVDGDDYIASNMTEKLVKAVEINNTLCSICGYIKTSSNGEYWVDLKEHGTLAISELNNKCMNIFSKNILNSPCNKLYVKEKIELYFDSGLSLGEDLLFNLQYLDKLDKVSFVGGKLYHYIEREGSLTKKYRSDSIDIAEKLYKASIEFVLKHDLGDDAVQDVSRIFIKSVIYGFYDIYVVSDMSSKDKREKISWWMKMETIQTALKHSRLENKQQTVAAVFIKKRWLNLLLIFLKVKQLQSFIRSKR